MIKSQGSKPIKMIWGLLFCFAVSCAKPAHFEQSWRPISKPVLAPAGAEGLGAQWIAVAAPSLGTMTVAVAKPHGKGPFPVALILHGTHGFAHEYVRLAQGLAANGVMGVAACWFAGGRGAGMRSITPISCPDAPPLSDASSLTAQKTVSALVHAVRNLQGSRVHQLVLVGHSRGAGAALNHILQTDDVEAAVLNSSGYPPEVTARAAEIKVPILMLHGTADSPVDGGSTFTNVQMAREFELAMRRAGKPVNATYYDGAGHSAIFSDANQFNDGVARIVAFLQRLPLN